LFVGALPALLKKKNAKDMICTPGEFLVFTMITDGIPLCLGLTSGRHKEGHKKAKNPGKC